MVQLIIGFMLLCLIFVPLERALSLNKAQKILRPGWRTDIIHFFLSNVLGQVGTYAIAVVVYLLLHRLLKNPLQEAILKQPGWLQFLQALFVANVAFYIVHRLAHTLPWLWKFHSIHHSSQNLDWLASVRLHPVEMIAVNLSVGIPLVLLGYSAETFGAWSILSTFLALLNHSNTRIRFGALNWLTPGPEYHHWHHANEAAAINKNYGHPVLDLMFGTYYLPEKRMPYRYGVDDNVPRGYWGQLLYPFKKRA